LGEGGYLTGGGGSGGGAPSAEERAIILNARMRDIDSSGGLDFTEGEIDMEPATEASAKSQIDSSYSAGMILLFIVGGIIVLFALYYAARRWGLVNRVMGALGRGGGGGGGSVATAGGVGSGSGGGGKTITINVQ